MTAPINLVNQFLDSLGIKNLQENMEELRIFCKKESADNLHISYGIESTGNYPYLVCLLMNDKSAVGCVCIFDKDCVETYFERMITNIHGSIENNYGFAPNDSKPMFSYKEIVSTIIRNNEKR